MNQDSVIALFYSVWDYVVLAFGLGFVIFFHELGHFLAAKYCDVKVEQFAVAFGPAIVAWRKGIGFRRGTTQPELERRLKEDPRAIIEKRIGETEYRLNWIPLGGYVKMLGQDDLRPTAAEDPRAYNKKSIRARMLIVSAGVIMNVILAFIGFVLMFSVIGYPMPPAMVGDVLSDSPAARAARADGTIVGLGPGDTIVSYAGNPTMGDFSKIVLNVALTREGTRTPIVVKHADGTQETLYVTPAHAGDQASGLYAIGITPPSELRRPDQTRQELWDLDKLRQTDLPDEYALHPGDTITQINGQDVKPDEYWKLYQATAASDGKPIDLTVQGQFTTDTSGKTVAGLIRHVSIMPRFQTRFDDEELSILGLVPRTQVLMVKKESPALNKLLPGDDILSIDSVDDHISNPTPKDVRDTMAEAGKKNIPLTITVLGLGDGKVRRVEGLVPNMTIEPDRKGMGITPGYDEQHLVIGKVLDRTPLAGKIPPGSTITAIDGQAVSNWFELRRMVAHASPGAAMSFTFTPPAKDASPETVSIKLSASDIELARQITFTQYLDLRAMPGLLHTHNPIKAIELGMIYTRDLILEFYVTLHRMITGDVSVRNVMGPFGMVTLGAKQVDKGGAWFFWFLVQISANLAVVNFLPIPITDGGLFVMLILEKIQGKPLSMETQRFVQLVGLVLIVGIFLLLTYQDIGRWMGYVN